MLTFGISLSMFGTNLFYKMCYTQAPLARETGKVPDLHVIHDDKTTL